MVAGMFGAARPSFIHIMIPRLQRAGIGGGIPVRGRFGVVDKRRLEVLRAGANRRASANTNEARSWDAGPLLAHGY